MNVFIIMGKFTKEVQYFYICLTVSVRLLFISFTEDDPIEGSKAL